VIETQNNLNKLKNKSVGRPPSIPKRKSKPKNKKYQNINNNEEIIMIPKAKSVERRSACEIKTYDKNNRSNNLVRVNKLREIREKHMSDARTLKNEEPKEEKSEVKVLKDFNVADNREKMQGQIDSIIRENLDKNK
jgi:hypothetical protein